MKKILFCIAVALLLGGTAVAENAGEIVEHSGVKGGVVVHLGCGDGTTTAALKTNGSFMLHGLDPDAANVEKARDALLSRGAYGPVSFMQLTGDRLPYIDNFVNLLVAEEPGKVGKDEMMRVLAPLGVLMLREGGKWVKTVKPRPEEIDDWTHYLYGPGNNAVSKDTVVGPPRRMQWVGGPRYSRHHDRMSSITAAVSAGGRLFYVIDEAPPVSILMAAQHTLVARDAFNGTILWKRHIDQWHSHLHPHKSGPAQLPRRLVAIGDRVYITLNIGGPVMALDAATGETLKTYAGTETTEEMICSDGVLYLQLRNRQPEPPTGGRKGVPVSKPLEKTLMAVSAETGETLWSVDTVIESGTLAADGDRVVFLSADRIVCLNRADGTKIWESDPVKVALAYSVKVTPVLVLYDGVVLFADSSLAVVNRLWSVNKPDTLSAFSAETGEKLWDAPHPLSGYMSPEDVLVLNGVVWVGATLSGYEKGNFKGYDVKTGELVGDFDPDVESYWFHHRCHRGKATEKYLMMSRVGIEYVDPKQQTWDLNHWVRGACLYGVIPANGLTYAPQHPCACYLESKLSGFNALAAGKRPAMDASVTGTRLLKGEAYGFELPDSGASDEDWPTFRGDNRRRGCATTPLPPDLECAWTAEIGGRLSTSTVAAGRVYLASIDNHTVHALDAESGEKLWRFTAGGRVDSPPTFWKGRLLFGSADGYVYCLKADDGKLVWRLRAAPIDQRVMSFEQLESVWPVHGSVLVEKDVAWCVAGRSIFLDGGLRLLRLDPATGEVLSETVLDDTDRETGRKVQDFGGQLNMPTALPDVLSCDGKHVYMHSQPFALDGTRLPLEQWTYGKSKPDQFSSSVNQNKAFAHIFSPTGLLDDTWWHRTYWLYGSRFIGGWAGYYQAGKRAPAGRILVMDDDRIYGFGRHPQFYRWTTPIEHHLFAVSKTKPKTQVGPPTRRGGAGFALLHEWTRDLPLFARAMLLSGKTLYLAGPADNVDEVAAFKNVRQFGKELAEQAEAFDGKRGGLLWIVDADTGEKLKELKLDTVPVFDGMSAAGKRLFISMKNGSLSCYRPPLPIRPKP